MHSVRKNQEDEVSLWLYRKLIHHLLRGEDKRSSFGTPVFEGHGARRKVWGVTRQILT